MMKKLLLLIVVLVLVAGCGQGDTMQKVVIEDRYSIDVPSSLTEATDLNDEASLQYQNIFKELYVIVIDEFKDDVHEAIMENEVDDLYTSDLDGYAALLTDNFEFSIQDAVISNEKEVKINGLPAKTLKLKGISEDIDVSFLFGFIEGKDRYYQVMTWTLTKRFEEHRDKMEKILASFREL
jgi:hypothetical protein